MSQSTPPTSTQNAIRISIATVNTAEFGGVIQGVVFATSDGMWLIADRSGLAIVKHHRGTLVPQSVSFTYTSSVLVDTSGILTLQVPEGHVLRTCALSGFQWRDFFTPLKDAVRLRSAHVLVHIVRNGTKHTAVDSAGSAVGLSVFHGELEEGDYALLNVTFLQQSPVRVLSSIDMQRRSLAARLVEPIVVPPSVTFVDRPPSVELTSFHQLQGLSKSQNVSVPHGKVVQIYPFTLRDGRVAQHCEFLVANDNHICLLTAFAPSMYLPIGTDTFSASDLTVGEFRSSKTLVRGESSSVTVHLLAGAPDLPTTSAGTHIAQEEDSTPLLEGDILPEEPPAVRRRTE